MPRKSMRSRSRSRRGGDWTDPSSWSLSNPFASKKPVDPNMPPSVDPNMPPSVDPNMPPSVAPNMPPSVTPNMPPSVAPNMPPAYPASTSSGIDYSQSSTSNGMGDSQSSTSNGMGGRKGKRRRSMRGGDYSDNISLNNLAANAAPFSNGNTATASYVGGRTRRHRHNKSCKITCRKHHRHTKSCRHRKH